MAPIRLRTVSYLMAVLLAFPPPSSAFDTPLSDTAVREAYFLGQRHDEALLRFLDNYTKYLRPPKTGPHVASIAFLTPFALLAQFSSQQVNGYSAQQAELDHRSRAESVKIVVQIRFTDSYGALIPRPGGSRSGASAGFVLRPYDFWKDFDVKVFNQGDALKPFTSSGEPTYVCWEDGGCTLTGATLYFEFLAETFTADTAAIEVDPPEGEPVEVEFNLAGLR